MKGIILAGGHGTRLFPLTLATSKQLLPVYDKPMIYYPLSVLMLAGIREVLVITTPGDAPNFRNLLMDGSQWGIDISYAVQDEPRGLADAFIIGKDFIGDDTVCLILGDNILFGSGIAEKLRNAASLEHGAIIFAYPVGDPRRYGVVEFDKQNKVISIEEKPDHPKSNYAIPGIYFYDNLVCRIASIIGPSPRGEIEVTDINNAYLDSGALQVQPLGRGVAWLDAGTHKSLLEASSFVEAVQNRQGLMISCPEEIAYMNGYIGADKLSEQACKHSGNAYGEYLKNLLGDNVYTEDHDDSTGKWGYSIDINTGDIIEFESEDENDKNTN